MISGPSDVEIERLLRAAPEERWQELWAVLDDFDPATADADQVEVAVAAIAAIGASVPFDWRTWDGLNRYPKGEGLDTAPVAEATRMVTAIVRAERFTRGATLARVVDGTLDAAVARIRRWHTEARAAG